MLTDIRLDAGEQTFFSRQLEYIASQTYDVEYPEIKARIIFPYNNEVGNWAEEYTYRQYDKVGKAKIVSSYAKDFPRVDIFGKEFTQKIKSMGVSYGYNIQEIRAAIKTGLALDASRAEVVRRAMMELENQIAWFGDASHNLQGFLSNTNIPNNQVAADGLGASTLWENKTPDQIIRDISVAVQTMMAATLSSEVPNTLLLPVKQWTMIATTPRSSTSDTTILNYIKAQFQMIQVIDWLPFELSGTGTGDSDQFILYRRDPRKLELIVPQDFEQFAPQQNNMDFEVPCHMRFGGVALRYPLSVAKWYGI